MSDRILPVEKKILSWVDKKIYIFWYIAVSIIAAFIRYSFFDCLSVDYISSLLPWFDEITASGGFSSLGTQTGDYNVLYQFLIACMTYIPIKPLYSYKILSCLFDYLLAWITACLVGICVETKKTLWRAVAYSMVLLSPIIFLDSSAWAQCDSIYIFFCLAALYFLLRHRYLLSFTLYGVAFAFKLQSIFLLPFFFFVYYRERNFSLFHFFLIPIVMIVSGLPGVLFGRNVFDVFSVYFAQADKSIYITMNYPTVWLLLYHTSLSWSYQTLHSAAILLSLSVMGIFMVFWHVNNVAMTENNKICMALILTYSCVLLLPSMHERYGMLYEVLAIVVFCIDKKTRLLLVPLCGISLATYGEFLFNSEFDLNLLAAVNTIIYILYTFLLNRKMLDNPELMTVSQTRS